MKQILFAFGPALLGTLLFTTAASATKTNFHADMSPDQENISPDLGDHNPTGTGDFTYDDVTKQLCGRITYSDLTGPAAGIHVHQAPPGDPTGDGTVKMLIPPAASPVTFNFTLDAAFETSLMAGEVYANVHTATNAKGELRTGAPWDVVAGPEVPCPAPTNPDGGVSSSSSSGDSGAPPTVPSTSGSPSSNGGTVPSTPSSPAGTSGDGTGSLTPSAPADPPKKSGCNATGSPSSALSLAFLVGLGIAAVSSRRKPRA